MGTTQILTWPSHSPDVSSCDHYPWSRLKGLVYSHPPPQSLKELRAKILKCGALIPAEELARGVNKTKDWCQQVVDAGGDNIN